MADRKLEYPGGVFRADTRVPGDKSLSHRALILAAMAAGRSRVSGLGPGEDVAATAAAIAAVGATAAGEVIESPGVSEWRHPPGPIDCRNSGTSLRLLAGALAGRPKPATLVGDASLSSRPMRRLVGPLEALGAEVETSAAGTAPVTVHAPVPLHGVDVEMPLASAQVRSAFALAALQAEGPSHLDSPPGFRDHTERWLAALGLGGMRSDTAFEVRPGVVPPAEYPVPGDPSSAAFLWAAAACVPGAMVTTREVSLNPGRLGFLEVLAEMGAGVATEVCREVHGDPVGVVEVTGRLLGPVQVAGAITVRALDELPLVAVVVAAGDAEVSVRDAGELRAKESDRIASTVALIRALGGSAEGTGDGFVVIGTGGLRGGSVDAAGDHRIAMAAAVAATVAADAVTVRGAEAAAVSWPGFYDRLERTWSSR